MAAAEPSWPIIINYSLADSELRSIFQSHNYKVRVSKSNGKDVVIFPLSSVAFFLLRLDEITAQIDGKSNVDQEVVHRIKKLRQIHRHCYVFAMNPSMSKREYHIILELQNRFLEEKLGFLLACSPKECAESMLNIAKITCKPLNCVVKERLQKLKSATVSDGVILDILSNLGLNSHQCFVLQQGCKSIANIATACEEDIIGCTLDQNIAQRIKHFFEKNKSLTSA
ncbi:uncharacterized protein LOC5514804 isoform X1 [Nematostella vectensis]|uniref:uncharacterized protein LOC5514804 isoform X1 n=1 Tax=Nematostella vectensis TaxID=45351 RepID=UPI0020771697|nr:uncharacterized protein LOC5514804 isoform X1 [Nematostella vectensis]